MNATTKLGIVFCVFILVISLVLAAGDNTQVNSNKASAFDQQETNNQENRQAQVNTITQNRAENTTHQNINQQNAVRENVRVVYGASNSSGASAPRFQIQQENQNRVAIETKGIIARTNLSITPLQFHEREQFTAMLSNGEQAQINMMPDEVAAMLRVRLGVEECEENCNIELREEQRQGVPQAVYRVQSSKQVKLFGLFKTRMRVQATFDASTGETLEAHKQWWAFLAAE